MADVPSFKWLSRDILLISLSAFFADLGYQAVIGLFPIYVKDVLHQSALLLGLLLAMSYGFGSLLSYLGGLAGQRFSKKKVALAGNLLIPLLSLNGVTNSVEASGSLFVGGWLARNFRSPPRRAMLAESAAPEIRKKAFGFLHALDVGGGMISAFIAFALLLLRLSVSSIMLLTIIPIFCSSAVLAMVREKKAQGHNGSMKQEQVRLEDRRAMKFFLLSAALFGFSYYSLGFPIITVVAVTHDYAYGILTYAIFLGLSGSSGYIFGSMKTAAAAGLWKFGYSLAAAGSFLIGLSYYAHLGLTGFYFSTAVLGTGTGAIETFEPVIASILTPASRLSRGMGALSAWRSVGLFTSNILMGFIFTIDVFYSYLYAALTAAAAAAIMGIVSHRTISLR